MKKTNLLIIPALILSFGAYAPAFAFDYGVTSNGSLNVGIESDQNQAKVSEESSTSADVENEMEANDTEHRSTSSKKEDIGENENATDTEEIELEDSNEHRSNVSIFVHSLLKIANREGGIGAEVRTIAKEQDDDASTTVEAMVKVETRNGFKTFLIGSDYKNLGVIRSELATTANQIARLKILAGLTVSAQDENELNAQIKLLEADQAKVEAFVKAHESQFSLFGWFVKLFVK